MSAAAPTRRRIIVRNVARSIAVDRPSRVGVASGALVFAATLAFALSADARGTDTEPLLASANATGRTTSAQPPSIGSTRHAVHRKRSQVQRSQGRAVRLAAKINAAVRRQARRHGSALRRHKRWVAAAIAQVRGRPAARRYDRLALEAARRHALPSALVRAVILVESGYKPGAVSPAGAMGLMQLMPLTATAMQVDDALDPRQNVLGGARLLRALTDRFADPVHAIAAYNAGAGAVLRYDGVPPYRETQHYVGRVLGAYHHYRTARTRL